MKNGTLENGRHGTETFIDFENEEYACYYDIKRDRCYYDVNGELLLIIDPQKINKIKKEYLKNRNKKLLGIGLISVAAGMMVFALARLFINIKQENEGLIQEF